MGVGGFGYLGMLIFFQLMGCIVVFDSRREIFSRGACYEWLDCAMQNRNGTESVACEFYTISDGPKLSKKCFIFYIYY